MLLLYLAFVLPYNVGFAIPSPPLYSAAFWFVVATDGYFAFDILFSFITCYYDADGVLVAERRRIFARYVRTCHFTFSTWLVTSLSSLRDCLLMSAGHELVMSGLGLHPARQLPGLLLRDGTRTGRVFPLFLRFSIGNA